MSVLGGVVALWVVAVLGGVPVMGVFDVLGDVRVLGECGFAGVCGFSGGCSCEDGYGVARWCRCGRCGILTDAFQFFLDARIVRLDR